MAAQKWGPICQQPPYKDKTMKAVAAVGCDRVEDLKILVVNDHKGQDYKGVYRGKGGGQL